MEQVSGSLSGLMYGSMACIILATLYNILRPTEETEFSIWWRQARYCVLVMFMCVIASVVNAFSVYNLLGPTGVLVGFTSSVCDSPMYFPAIGGMSAMLLLIGVLAFVMAF